jgi:NAD(P)-dependent dehydrogenase (short-subunit alcohol dehydrogenase family)
VSLQLFSLSGRVALVTGGNGGIGRALSGSAIDTTECLLTHAARYASKLLVP